MDLQSDALFLLHLTESHKGNSSSLWCPNQPIFSCAIQLHSAYLTSLVLAVAAFVADVSFNGGDNALSFSSNNFNGTLPTQLGMLTSLQKLLEV
nr:hypothetical protein CFP56_30603 [Quercus suber]